MQYKTLFQFIEIKLHFVEIKYILAFLRLSRGQFFFTEDRNNNSISIHHEDHDFWVNDGFYFFIQSHGDHEDNSWIEATEKVNGFHPDNTAAF